MTEKRLAKKEDSGESIRRSWTRGIAAGAALVPFIILGTILGLGFRIVPAQPKGTPFQGKRLDVADITVAQNTARRAMTPAQKPVNPAIDGLPPDAEDYPCTWWQTDPTAFTCDGRLFLGETAFGMAEALDWSDRESRKGGWEFSSEMTARMQSGKANGQLRAYRRSEYLRIVSILPKVNPKQRTHPITVFECTVAGRRDPAPPAHTKEEEIDR